MTLSDIERKTNQLTDENLSFALHTLEEQGFVILEAALPQSCVTKMRNLFDEESKRQFGDMGGEGELQTLMGLSADAFQNVITQVGNYDEIYSRNLNPVGLNRAGSSNAGWTDGGLIYAPPAR